MKIRMPGARQSFSGVVTDSREAQPGSLFFALRGTAMDGHDFIPDAIGRGATGVVVEKPVAAAGAEMILVPDAWAALYDLAGSVLTAVHPVVVGVTGSNGKTSTKEMLAAALAPRFGVLATAGNLNTETGVPLTILRLEAGRHDALVLEMGMQGPGEIARLAELARPAVGVVTGIGTVHIEYFESVEGIARAKAELVQALPADGLAVLNHDDPFTPLLRELSAAPVRTFGLEGGDYRGLDYHDGRFTVRGVAVELGLRGRHQARNALAALAAADHLGVPLAEAAAAIRDVRLLEHRYQAIATAAGYEVIDDAYNASPESMLAAFDTLADQPVVGRRLGVLGEMRELGPLAANAHREVGGRARAVFDAVCVIDTGNGRLLAEAAGAELVADRDAAADWVRSHAQPGDVVLVKASHGVGLYGFATALTGPS
ncbi:MAG: UDP-N-acetylmuramoyl-tripeptide--D-alanyl-D-alanine ligase [Candidatus Dormibacteraceae bacterium]